MPTTRPRHMITETEELESMLETAARHWPEAAQSRQHLLRLLIETGAATIRARDETAWREHRESVRQHAGLLSGLYDKQELARLRADWPQ